MVSLHGNGQQWNILVLLVLIPMSFSPGITQVSSSVPACANLVWLIEELSLFNNRWHSSYAFYLLFACITMKRGGLVIQERQ